MLKQETKCFAESCSMLSSLLVPIAQGELCLVSDSYLFTRLFDILENKMQNVHRLTCPVNKSMFPKELGKAREGYAPGNSCLRGPAHGQPRHPPGQPAADSISPPFLPGSTVHCLLCCSLSSACISEGGEGISQSYAVCWECQ